MHAKFDSGLDGGILVANPIPNDHAMEEATIQKAIDQALKNAKQEGITGKHITPYLLDAVKTITQGKSLSANLALMKHNAQVAAQIAVAYRP
jgi:pseudouridine-5'-phosphate glycosidase